jgi:hypothetical protein
LQREAARNIGKSWVDDLTGKKFSRLTVLSRVGNSKDGKPMWLCSCDCGKEVAVRAVNLRNGASTSCGCYSRELSAKKLTTHGLSRTLEYIRAKAKRRHRRLKSNPLYRVKARIRSLIRKSIVRRGCRKESPTHTPFSVAIMTS